jgi:NADH-quinone oxidoreductase subunit H
MTSLVEYMAGQLPWLENLLRVYPGLTWAFFWLVWGAAVMGFITVYALLIIWAERRVAGFIQCRYGPNRVGPFGLLQSIADGVKLLLKEDIIPDRANKFMFAIAPVIVFVGVFIPFVALPFSQNILGASMDLGVFFVVSFMSLEVIGVIMAGWASNSKWSLYGGMRLAAQMMSYEIPLGMCVATVAVFTGSLNMNEIVEAQGPIWNVFRSPFLFIAFIVFYIAALASAKRAPFDLPEAESELVSGFHTEYSGMRFSFFFLAEYAAMYVLCALGAILFLGGWYGPIPVFWLDLFSGSGTTWALSMALPPATVEMIVKPLLPGNWLNLIVKEIIFATNLLIKSGALLFLMLQIRWTLPRLRIDQVMSLCWKYLLPFMLVCFFGAAAQAVLFNA